MGATATLYRIVISSDPLAFLIVRDYGCRGFALVSINIVGGGRNSNCWWNFGRITEYHSPPG